MSKIPQEAIEAIMEQAQVFASTYSLVGGRFDDGSKMEQSNEEKAELRSMVCTLMANAARAQGMEVEPLHGWVCYNSGPGEWFWSEDRSKLDHELSDEIRPATHLEKYFFNKQNNRTYENEPPAPQPRPLTTVGEEAEKYRVERGEQWCKIFDTLRHYSMSNMIDEYGGGYPLVDLVSRDGEGVSIADGEYELVIMTDEIALAIAPPAPQPTDREKVLEEIAAERARQITGEGWTPEHDDHHDSGEMAEAAAGYALKSTGTYGNPKYPPNVWPWDIGWWKPTTPRRDLVKAAALLVAEIERLDRAALAGGEA